MVIQWVFVGFVLLVFAGWATVLLYQERRAHNRTLDRLMALAQQPAAVAGSEDGFFFQDLETGEMRPLVRSGHASVEDVEGSMQPGPVTPETIVR